MEIINLEENKKAYFSSDNHLGLPGKVNSLEREKIFIKWLDSIKDDAQIFSKDLTVPMLFYFADLRE